jgi:signal transduction histidine kinase
MISSSRPLFASRTDRTIAVSRVMLAASSLLAVWLDPNVPAQYVALAFTLHQIYVGYSIVLALIMWSRPIGGRRLPMLTHVVDISVFSLEYLALGPSSPFFIYFIFALFCAALRWDWRGTLATTVVVLTSYLIIAALVGTLGSTPEQRRFTVRIVYLAMIGGLLVYLGQHETRLRAEIERLGRWPPLATLDPKTALGRVLAHAAHIVAAEHVTTVWEVEDEPWVHVVSWSSDALQMDKRGPEDFLPLVPEALSNAAFLCATTLDDQAVVFTETSGVTSEWTGLPIGAPLFAYITGQGLTSAPFHTDRVSGRVFLSGLRNADSELLSLTRVVAREVGASLDQLEMSEQLREIAAREQRIRLARDLHDGVLQSLTGMRFELQGIATESLADAPSVRARLLALERALAIEQRELRLFIDELKPSPVTPAENVMMTRLQELRERIALEWKVPVTVRLNPPAVRLSDSLEQAVPLMAHEAIVNALKYARPSRISIDIHEADGLLRMAVSDDGCGFPFRGRYEHATLVKLDIGPVSLRERAMSLGGQMTIDSTETGSRVEIALPVGAGRA